MKRVALSALLSLLVVGLSFAEAPIGMTIGTNSVKILPQRGPQSAVAWTNGIALAQGQMTLNNSRLYMAEAAIGASTNEPTHLSGTSNDLRYVPNRARKLCTIQNASTNLVFLNIDFPAEAGKGITIYPKVALTFENYQNAFYVIADAASSEVRAVEVSQ